MLSQKRSCRACSAIFGKASFATTLLLFVSLSVFAEPQHLTILHFNDLHGHVEQALYIATLIKQIKKSNEEKGSLTLVLNGGDLISGTMVSGKFKGEAEFKFLNAIDDDAMVLGNHDFDFGMEALQKDMAIAKFSVLAANIYEKDSGHIFASPFVLISPTADLKIAIFGLTHANTPQMTNPKNVSGLEFDEPISTAKKLMKGLVKKSDIQIALTHVGVKKDMELAQRVKNIDIVIGGHDHVKPEAHCRKVRKVPVCQTPPSGTFLGRIDMDVDDGKVSNVHTSLIPVEHSIKKDDEVAKLMAPFESSVAAEMRKVAGKTNGLNRIELARLVTDLMRETTGAQVSFLNNTGVRDVLPKGVVTMGRIYKIFPFDNKVVASDLLGKDIVYLVKKSETAAANIGAGVLTFSGITYKMKDGEPVDIMIGGRSLDAKAYYRTATINFLANGGDGYKEPLARYKWSGDGLLIRDLLMESLRGAKRRGNLP